MLVTMDFETYWSPSYSLSRMSEVEYILSPLFQTILVSIKLDDGPIRSYSEPADVRDALGAIDWQHAAMLSHNARFDATILAWHYGYVPALYLDTLSMARALTHCVTGSSSLKAVAEHLGFPPKGDEVLRMQGRRREDLSHGELEAYAAYCAHDTELAYLIFKRFMDEYRFPASELKVIDLALRMFIFPQARLDMFKLAVRHNELQVERERMFANADRSLYASNPRFAELLQEHGVDVPRKVSATTRQITWALAKNDLEFKRLCDDPTQPLAVQMMLALRRNAKSTIEETRTARMLELSRRDWSDGVRGWMPVPYLYYGAHTGRFAGSEGFNFANLPRGSVIRDSIVAPEGHRVVHRDASQIECRMLAWLARCHALLDGFRDGIDIYCDFATRCYLRPITKADVKERFAGKTAVLSLGYGASAEKFRQTLYVGQGGVSMDMPLADAVELVKLYRVFFREIPDLWGLAGAMINEMITGRDAGRLNKVIEVKHDRAVLPNGLAVRYPDLQQAFDPASGRPEITYRGPRGERKKLYGAKFVENITQALARIVVTDVMVRVFDRTGYRPFMGTYDSWAYIIPEAEVQSFDQVLLQEFDRPPTWAPDLPLASEGGWGRTLLEAERGVNQ